MLFLLLREQISYDFSAFLSNWKDFLRSFPFFLLALYVNLHSVWLLTFYFSCYWFKKRFEQKYNKY